MKYLFIALALMMPLNNALADDVPGMTTLSIPAAHHGRDLKMSVAYPAEGGTETLFGDNPVFTAHLSVWMQNHCPASTR